MESLNVFFGVRIALKSGAASAIPASSSAAQVTPAAISAVKMAVFTRSYRFAPK